MVSEIVDSYALIEFSEESRKFLELLRNGYRMHCVDRLEDAKARYRIADRARFVIPVDGIHSDGKFDALNATILELENQLLS